MSEPILRGRLEDHDVGGLLSALQLGRQYFTLEVYDAAGDCTGVVAVKAGRIVSASVDGFTGNEAVRRLLQRRGSAEFRVLLQPTAADMEDVPLDTLAVISQVVNQPNQPITESDVRTLPARTRVLQGVLSDHLSFDDILRGVASSRQLLALTLSDAAGHALGEVVVKSNKVLSAIADELHALPALRQLQRAPTGSHFALFAESHGVTQLPPLGTVAEMLSRGRDSGYDLPSSSSNGVRKTMSRWVQDAPTPQRSRILEGSLEDFELSHVLRGLSTSRQHFELQLQDESAVTLGVIEVKSGFLLAASTDKLSGVPAAHELLRVQKGRFVAIRRAEQSSTSAKPALLSVSELLQPKAAAAPSGMVSEDTPEETQAVTLSRAVGLSVPDNSGSSPIPVMDGRLGELDVPSILSVAGASRQYTCLHIFDDQRRPMGVIHLKSGQVVSAQAQDVSGVAAVRRLLHCPRDFSFLVQRYPNASEVTSSIGSIATVLARAAAQPAAGTQAAAVTQPLSSGLKRRDAPSSSWMGGAVLGAGFVLLGGIATALVLNSPALNAGTYTSISPISTPPQVLAPKPAEPAPPPAAQREAAPAPATQRTQVEPSTTDEAKALDPSAPLSRATIASLQAGLQQLGYETGPIDGVIGQRTAAAIKAFQYAEHLKVDGNISAPTRAVLLRRISEP